MGLFHFHPAVRSLFRMFLLSFLFHSVLIYSLLTNCFNSDEVSFGYVVLASRQSRLDQDFLFIFFITIVYFNVSEHNGCICINSGCLAGILRPTIIIHLLFQPFCMYVLYIVYSVYPLKLARHRECKAPRHVLYTP